MDIHHKHRWVFSPLAWRESTQQWVPVAEDYCVSIDAPYFHDGHALCACTMNAHQFAAALKDPRLVVYPSIHHHHRHKIPARVAEHHAVHGLHAEMTIHESMELMAELHPAFHPEH